jgi:hypothetical protein
MPPLGTQPVNRPGVNPGQGVEDPGIPQEPPPKETVWLVDAKPHSFSALHQRNA